MTESIPQRTMDRSAKHGAAVRARPILFSAPMVRALLAGTKTQTRRVVKFADWQGSPANYLGPNGNGDHVFTPTERWGGQARCPYGVPDDVLWVRETLKRAPDLWTYAADGAQVGWPARRDLAHKVRDTVVSIHMPRDASRISLRITDVRVERLNEISRRDACAEGLEVFNFTGWGDEPGVRGPPEPDVYRGFREADWTEYAPEAYRALWEHINGPGSWDANPWVWAVSFKVITGAANADTTGGQLGPGRTP
jgi:hypothetical protein